VHEVIENQTFFITGSNGFIGSALCHEISKANGLLVRIKRSKSLTEQIEFAKGINLANSVLVLCDWEGVYKDRDSLSVQRQNIDRWTHLAREAINCGIPKIVALGSQAEIDSNQAGVTAQVSFRPRNEYGKAKAHAFTTLNEMTLGKRTSLVWARLFSVYGPGISKNSLIYKIVDSLLKEEEIQLSAGDQNWNFLFKSDCAKALKSIASSNSSHAIYNIASAKTHTIKQLACIIGEELDRLASIRFGTLPYATDEVFDMSPDIAELVSTGWKEEIDFRTGIQLTVQALRKELDAS
jgi:nucleoside-diphosphate-sugar epimerase